MGRRRKPSAASRRVELRRALASEPQPCSTDWVEWGGELMMAMGFTEGGAPYGLALDDFREMNERDERARSWVRAKGALRSAFERACPDARVEIGFVKKLGEGLSRDVFAADVRLSPDPSGRSGAYAVLIPRRGADRHLAERTDREGHLLAALRGLSPPFRLPEVVGTVTDGVHRLLVRSSVQGIELDLRAGRYPGARPWEIVGEAAATVHGLEVPGLVELVPGHTTRREHAFAAIEGTFAELSGDICDRARAWAHEHVPPAEPATLLHGDLLGQNILISPGAPPALIDWEYASRGDPAYDLAIVTRGVRQPFQIDRGLERLLEAYESRSGRHIERSHVLVHELCLAAKWYRESLEGTGRHPPEQALNFLRSILRRAVT